MSERIPSKIESLIEIATEATVEPAGMFFSTKKTPRGEVETIARTAINAFLLNLKDVGGVLKIDLEVYAQLGSGSGSTETMIKPEGTPASMPTGIEFDYRFEFSPNERRAHARLYD